MHYSENFFHVNSFLLELEDMGRQIAEKANEPFDFDNLFIEPAGEGLIRIRYIGQERSAEAITEIAGLNIALFDPEEIKII